VINAHQCRTCAADCAARAQGSGVSLRRAAILNAMSKCWAKLAGLTEEYENAKRQEGGANSHCRFSSHITSTLVTPIACLQPSIQFRRRCAADFL
jgi:hypothetical protein